MNNNNFEQCCDPLDNDRAPCSNCPHLDNCKDIHKKDISHTFWEQQEKNERLPRQDERDSL